MSVLNFPRIYFNGEMEWNPPTANNNDVFPLYDAVNIKLNWDFLKDLTPPITQNNIRESLYPWMLKTLQKNDVPEYVSKVPNNAGSFPMMPAEWNLFGDNACSPVEYGGTHSRVIGGQITPPVGLKENYIENDPFVHMDFKILGNPFGSNKPTPGRFVDISPWQNTFTAFYFDQMVFGDENTGIKLKREYRMLDRFLNFNWAAIKGLSTVTTTWQTCFPRENITWYEGDSNLLKALREKLENDPKAKGLMVRFSTYLTFYDKNGIFNDYPVVESHGGDDSEIRELYEKALENSSDIFFNPAYSKFSGTLGLWYDDEFPTAPGGRRLQKNNNDSAISLSNEKKIEVNYNVTESLKITSDINVNSEKNISVPLGVMLAELNGQTLSLDVSNTFPFYVVPKSESFNITDKLSIHLEGNKDYAIPISEKFNSGDFDIQVINKGKTTKIATISYEQYCQSAFDMKSGLIDVDIKKEHVTLFETGSLQLVKNGVSYLSEVINTAEIIESGTFIDVGEEKTLNIMLQEKGKPITAGTKIWVTQYGNPYNVTTSDYYIGFDDPDNNVDFVLYSINKEGESIANLPSFSDIKTVIKTNSHGISRSNFAKTAKPQPIVQTEDKPIMYKDVKDSPVGLSLSAHVGLVGAQTFTKKLSDGKDTLIRYQALQVEADRDGIAKIKIRGLSAGFPTLLFSFAKEPDFAFSFSSSDAYVDFMAPIRVLPNEKDLVAKFVDKWNSLYKQEDAPKRIWDEFIYPEVLEVFYYLYPIMSKYMPLDQLSRVEGAVDQLIVLISAEYRNESTLAMPITRDLPASSRAVLELWATKLVKLNYPPRPLSLP